MTLVVAEGCVVVSEEERGLHIFIDLQKGAFEGGGCC